MFLLVGKGEIFGYYQVCPFGSTLFTKPEKVSRGHRTSRANNFA